MCQRKANRDLEHCLSATYGVRARPAPNLQNPKSLNFQEKIERKSKMSKQAMLKVLKLLKLAKRLGMATISRKVSHYLLASISGVESLGGVNLSSHLRSKAAYPIYSGMSKFQGHLMGSSSPRNLRSDGTQ